MPFRWSWSPWSAIALGAALGGLAGCQTGSGTTVLAPAVVSTGCPDVVPHDAEWQKGLVGEVTALPPAAKLRTVTREWANGRSQARACKSGSK